MPCSRHACARLSRWRAFPPSPSPSPPPPPTPPGHPFACGLTLDRITGYTVDEHGREAFVTANPLSMLRKALQLRRMAAYFDTDAEFWDPGRSWPDMPLAEWDVWFQVSPPPPPQGLAGACARLCIGGGIPCCSVHAHLPPRLPCPAARHQPGPPGEQRHCAAPRVRAAAGGRARALLAVWDGAEAGRGRARIGDGLSAGRHRRAPVQCVGARDPLPSLCCCLVQLVHG